MPSSKSTYVTCFVAAALFNSYGGCNSFNASLNETLHANAAKNSELIKVPTWVIEFMKFRQELFLTLVEPVIQFILGPLDPTIPKSSKSINLMFDESFLSKTREFASSNATDEEISHARKLSYIPEYIHNMSLINVTALVPDYVGNVSNARETSMSFATLAVLFFCMSCMMFIFLNCFYHNQKTSPLFISPRRHRLPKLVPPPLPIDGFFNWVKVILFISDEEIINRIGYDALIFLRFHRLGLRCIVKMSVFAFSVLLPLNFTGGESAQMSNDLKGYVDDLFFTDNFAKFTMANISSGSPRLWIHCFGAYLLTGIVLRELLAEYNAFHNIRHRYLLSKEAHLRTVLVSNIPRHLRSPQKITNYFKNVYPNAVKSVTIAQNLLHLEKLVAARTKVLDEIEMELLILCRNEKRKLVEQSGWDRCRLQFSFWNLWEIVTCCDGAQDRLTKLYNKLEDMNDKVEKEQTRRRRIMKKLDRMEAGEGRQEIDYYLASPFVSDPEHMKTLGLSNHIHHLNFGPKSTTSFSGPRNPDGSIKNMFTYEPPSFNQSSSIEGTITTPPQINVSQRSDGLKLRSPPRSEDENDTNDQKHKNREENAIQNNNGGLKNEDSNNKQPRKSLSKAKLAIRRYSQKIKDANINILGQPIITSGSNLDGKSPNSFDFIEDHTNEVTDKAFVVMRTFTASTIAIQSMHSARPGAMQVTTAPEPRDILWENIYVSKGARRMRAFIGDTIVMFLIVFYIVPVAIVSLLVSEQALTSSSPRLEQLDHASPLFSSALAMVQPLCIVGIQQLLPPLFVQIGKAEGIVSFSDVQMRTFSRYFTFQVLNVFLVTAVAGSIFDTLARIIDKPEFAFRLLGNSLPKMSAFFITFVMTKTFLGLGVELVRIMSIMQAVMRYILFPVSTLRQQRSVRLSFRAIDDPGWFPFHKVLAQDMLVVVISVVFAVVAPLVLLPCGLFCFVSRITFTHHHLYVYESVFETGGQFWPKIFRRFIFGLIIAQATITGQFMLKDARIEALATLVLMFMTYIFLRSTRARFDQSTYTLPLEVATIMDISVSQEKEMKKMGQSGIETWQDTHGQRDTKDTNEYDDRGVVIGNVDPFEFAYVQPVLRATARARPEQPFPPAQLGREEVFLNYRWEKHSKMMSSSSSLFDDVAIDDCATVRLKSMNQEDRKVIDEWWNEQMQAAGKQDWLSVVAGQKCGTLLLGSKHFNKREQEIPPIV